MGRITGTIPGGDKIFVSWSIIIHNGRAFIDRKNFIIINIKIIVVNKNKANGT